MTAAEENVSQTDEEIISFEIRNESLSGKSFNLRLRQETIKLQWK